MIPSLARARYNNNQIIDQLGAELLRQFRDDYKLISPMYLKILVERILSLDYVNSEEARRFFTDLQGLVKKRKQSLILESLLGEQSKAVSLNK